jgi:ABC-type nitrate/sulfonate/bicarbonate transport system permease component
VLKHKPSVSGWAMPGALTGVLSRWYNHERLAMIRRVLLVLAIGLAVGLLIYAWLCLASNNSNVVSYFGRPWDAWLYVMGNWKTLLRSSAMCLSVAAGSLVLAAFISLLLLAYGLYSPKRLPAIERFAAYLQTVPMFVVVTICLVIERELFKILEVKPTAYWYCVLPVTIALMFPPLANGAGAIRRTLLEVKQLLRLWDVPRVQRIRKVYLPLVLPDVLTGVRSSATWAVSATLVVEALLNGVAGQMDTLGHAFLGKTSADRLLSVVVVSSALGYLLYVAVASLQGVIERWLQGKAAEAADLYPLQAE